MDASNQESGGQDEAASSAEIFPLVYTELKQMAAAKMARESSGHTLQPTALVHEAFVRLRGSQPKDGWVNERQFFAASSEAMRRILIEHARKKNSQKRGGGVAKTVLDDSKVALETPADEVLAVNDALDQLAEVHPEAAELVKLRYFVGFSREEAAAALEIPPRTTDRIWAYAKAWLARELDRQRSD